MLFTSACGSSATASLGDADGVIPDNGSVSPFDTSRAAIGNLDPALLAAVQQAARDAQAHGIAVKVTSGWRSKAYQQQLLDDAVHKYGSLEQARQFVNTPDKSTHVTGKAVTSGPRTPMTGSTATARSTGCVRPTRTRCGISSS
jgi:LAS superfamily LD-carboxypeptidase LdcB